MLVDNLLTLDIQTVVGDAGQSHNYSWWSPIGKVNRVGQFVSSLMEFVQS